MNVIDIDKLAQISEIEFSDIVEDTISGLNRMRIFLRDSTFIDIWYSLTNYDRYAYHWDRKNIDGMIYRHNNAPHKKWLRVSTFPKHFHNGFEDRVETSEIPKRPDEAIRYFLNFVRTKIKNSEIR